MIKSWKDDPRSSTNPIFNDNRLKLGLFGLNAGHQIMSLAPDRYLADWERSDAIVGIADGLGLEAVVSLMGWGDKTELEPFTWATGLAARHGIPSFMATMHVQLMHPAFVAKAAATADLVSGGRFGLNLVAGSNPATFGTFGKTIEDHETRYSHATEWVQLLRRFWLEEEPFNFEGQFYSIKKSVSYPKPVQKFPAIMNAGTSGRGRDFACEHADIVFTHLPQDDEDARRQCDDYRLHARETFGREIQLWTHGYAVIRSTEKESKEFLDYYAVQHADKVAAERWVATLGMTTMPGAERWKFDRNWAAGGGVALVGSGEQVADRLASLSRIGIDGILLNTIEPETMLGHLAESILPQLEAAGLRKTRLIKELHPTATAENGVLAATVVKS